MESLGEKIRKLRMIKGMTQSQLGEGLVTASMLSQIEAGKANPSFKVLEAIAERLNTPIDHFLSNIPNQMNDGAKHKVAKALIGANEYQRASTILIQLYDHAAPSHFLSLTEVCLDLAVCFLKMERFDEATDVLEKCLHRCEEEGNSTGIVMTLHKMGIVELAKKKFYAAIFYLRSAYIQFDSLQVKHPMLKTTLALDLGNLYLKVGDTTEAVKTFDSVRGIINENENPQMLALTYLGLSESFLSLDEYQQATEYATIASALFEAQNNIKDFVDIQKRMNLLTANESNFEEVAKTLFQYVSQLETHKLLVEAGALLEEIASLYLQHGEYDKCLKTCSQALKNVPDSSAESAPIFRTIGMATAKKGHSKAAIRHLQHAVEIFQRNDLLSEVANTYGELASVYEAMGNYEASNRCLQIMKRTLVDSLRKRGIVL